MDDCPRWFCKRGCRILGQIKMQRQQSSVLNKNQSSMWFLWIFSRFAKGDALPLAARSHSLRFSFAVSSLTTGFGQPGKFHAGENQWTNIFLSALIVIGFLTFLVKNSKPLFIHFHSMWKFSRNLPEPCNETVIKTLILLLLLIFLISGLFIQYFPVAKRSSCYPQLF